MKKILIIAGIAFVFVIFFIFNLKAGKKINEVEIEVIKRMPIFESVKVDGYLEAHKQVEIGSEVIGKIKKIYVKKGELVKKDELLCIIDPSEYEAQRDRIKVMLEEGLYELELAKKNFEREKKLFEKNLISQKEFEEAEASFKRLLFKIKTDSFNLKEIEERLSKCFLKSPIDGEVIEIYKREGETVTPGTINNPASIIMVIADRNKMIVKCEVDETEILKIEKGQKVKIKIDALPDTIFEGIVTRIGGMRTSSRNVSEQNLPSFTVEIEMKGEYSFLLPGMSASCEIITQEKDNSISLPYSAIGREKGEKSYYIFLYKNSKAEKRYVKTGIKGIVRVEITGDIKEGDTVITGPEDVLRKLKEGEKVKIRKFKEREK